MAKGRINKSAVDDAFPREGDWFLWDDKLSGFGLKVTPKGGKVFIYQYRLGGRGSKVRRCTLGKAPGLTADKARGLAADLYARVTKGDDPQREKQEERRKATDLAFAAFSERFINDHLKFAWASAHDDGAALLRRYAVPVLNSMPLHQIDRKAITRVLARTGDKAATARNLFAALRLLFNWAIEVGELDRSPMEGQKPPASPPSRDRVLDDAELVVIWNASLKLEYPFGPLVRLLVLTGARREEVAGLDWSELDHSAKVWNLPASRAKNGVAALLPLSELAQVEIDALAKRSGKEKDWPRRGLLFSTNGNSSVSGFSKAKHRLDKLVVELVADDNDLTALEPWRLHDLRRTMATGLQRLGIRFEVTEAMLHHVSGAKSGVAGVYQRHDWKPEKIEAAAQWSAKIASLLNPSNKSNVVPITAAANA